MNALQLSNGLNIINSYTEKCRGWANFNRSHELSHARSYDCILCTKIYYI